MSLHLTKRGAMEAASIREIEAAQKALNRRRSSGHRYRRFGYRKQFFVFWEAFEYSPHQRPRIGE